MRWLVLLTLCGFLSSCGLSSLGILSGGGGGPTVNSNAQIGKENKQAAVSFEEETNAGRDIITTTKEVEAGVVDSLQILNTNIPPWVILLLILGWLLPTPTEIARGSLNFILTLFRRNPNVRINNNADVSRSTSSNSEPSSVRQSGDV